jgi:hypothetical protein
LRALSNARNRLPGEKLNVSADRPQKIPMRRFAAGLIHRVPFAKIAPENDTRASMLQSWYLTDMGTGYWFKPKSFGYGATPVSWQGWAWTLGMALIIAAAIVIAVLAQVQHWSDRRALQALCTMFGGLSRPIESAVWSSAAPVRHCCPGKNRRRMALALLIHQCRDIFEVTRSRILHQGASTSSGTISSLLPK